MAAPAKTLDGLPAEKWVELYTLMVRIRVFEERILPLLKEGRIKGTAHPSVGQEAVAAGVCGILQPKDYIVSNHRGHGHCIAKGMRTPEMMAELYGKRTGSNKGKGGSMHIADLDQYIIGCTGIVGSGAQDAADGHPRGAAGGTCFHADGGVEQGPANARTARGCAARERRTIAQSDPGDRPPPRRCVGPSPGHRRPRRRRGRSAGARRQRCVGRRGAPRPWFAIALAARANLGTRWLAGRRSDVPAEADPLTAEVICNCPPSRCRPT